MGEQEARGRVQVSYAAKPKDGCKTEGCCLCLAYPARSLDQHLTVYTMSKAITNSFAGIKYQCQLNCNLWKTTGWRKLRRHRFYRLIRVGFKIHCGKCSWLVRDRKQPSQLDHCPVMDHRVLLLTNYFCSFASGVTRSDGKNIYTPFAFVFYSHYFSLKF